jgi:hypothetical protein
MAVLPIFKREKLQHVKFEACSGEGVWGEGVEDGGKGEGAEWKKYKSVTW